MVKFLHLEFVVSLSVPDTVKTTDYRASYGCRPKSMYITAAVG